MSDRYGIDPNNGFLPGKAPLQALPQAYAQWDEIAGSLSELLNAHSFRSTVEAMPVISDITALETSAELERAMLLLSCFGHAFVWEDYQSSGYIPPSIAVPWTQVADRLARPPTLAHASLVLQNWRLLDPDGPVVLGNIATLIQFHGGLDESWFYLVTTEIESTGAGILREFDTICSALMGPDLDKVAGSLQSVYALLGRLRSTLNRMYEHCDPYIFYHRVRPFLASFERIEYRGCDPLSRDYFGGSAAQSSLLQAIDAMFGVGHREDKARSYLQEMRNYMPRRHAAYIAQLESRPSLARSTRSHAGCHRALDACIEALAEFRQDHLKMVARYIMAQTSQAGPGHTGTGGTDPMIFLRQVTQDTRTPDQ
ncbi:MAG: hypothetical protein CMK60_05160 [Proteobacteria bacterium]|jgi:indoleamine 2,3-dioxygenase|nr:hypothetical protein [Pseudomonadota bacterium]MBP08802.1 hypothetical protein [Acidiferrobacteraceae bacterium]MDP6136055.1 hypothetical protein [Arenicellales bacterium]HCF72244.1 hypothetical protein [Gammaproteobacteria bacterium]MDP7218137.1 hypothetical protein [Arenicellales bacterium]|tara:strand:+ start:16271 stop:17377 length:1107 start_codon:yes stop_codon:yes gene_type:complete